MKIRKGDTIAIMTGKDRGKTGKVLRVFPRENRILVGGAALQTRHRRARRAREKGQRVTIPGPIALSNVKVVCGSCGKPTRVGFQIGESVKLRVCRKCGSTLS